MVTKIECTAEQLAEICREADEAYFGVAADLGLCFRGGFDYAEPAKNGWSVKLHDRGMNDRCRDFVFRVPMAQRTSGQGPAK